MESLASSRVATSSSLSFQPSAPAFSSACLAFFAPGMGINEDLDKIEQIKKFEIEYAPVVDSSRNDKFLGVLSSNAVQRKLSAEVVAKQLEADSMYVPSRG